MKSPFRYLFLEAVTGGSWVSDGLNFLPPAFLDLLTTILVHTIPKAFKTMEKKDKKMDFSILKSFFRWSKKTIFKIFCLTKKNKGLGVTNSRSKRKEDLIGI